MIILPPLYSMFWILHTIHQLDCDFNIPDGVHHQRPTDEIRSRVEKYACSLALFAEALRNSIFNDFILRTRGDGIECSIDRVIIDGNAWILFVELGPGFWNNVSIRPLSC